MLEHSLAEKEVEEEAYIFEKVVPGKRGISKWNMWLFPFFLFVSDLVLFTFGYILMGPRRNPREKIMRRKNKGLETDSWGSGQMEKNKHHRFNSQGMIMGRDAF